MERNAFMKVFLKIVGVLGVSLVMSGLFEENTAMTRADEISKMESSRRLSLCLEPFKGETYRATTIQLGQPY